MNTLDGVLQMFLTPSSDVLAVNDDLKCVSNVVICGPDDFEAIMCGNSLRALLQLDSENKKSGDYGGDCRTDNP